MANDLNSWDGFLGSNFLSAEDVKDENQEFFCIGVELDTENEKVILVLESDLVKSKFSLNVTNANFIKDEGVKNPNEIIGKKLTFKKVLVRNPRTKKEVEGLRIKSVEQI